ncbi:MAG: MBL fold metallo-hydrolase [Bacteroidia bacterium]
MKLTFWGAAQQVTGSKHLLELEDGTTVLIDCGLDYEDKKNFDLNNSRFPFDPESIDLLILTHAHIDHSGNIPNLIKQGFEGTIVCTTPTLELSDFLLHDSLNIQRMEIQRKRKKFSKNKKGKRYQEAVPTPLYSAKHIMQMLDLVETVDFGEKLKFNDHLSLQFYPAGHILGAASVVLEVKENGETKRIGFTGDLGNKNSKLVPDPTPMPKLKYLVSESTYGGRRHEQVSNKAEEIMLREIQETCVENGGKLVVPAFSVGRTQAILFTLHQLFRDGKLPNIKIFTDSPLAIKSTKVYQYSLAYLNEEAKAFHAKYGSLFDFDNLYVIQDEKESEVLSEIPEPCVIISAAGMVEGGRIQMHVKNNIGGENNTVLIAGFCAEGTLGHRLLSGQDFVEINHKPRAVRAAVRKTDAFSAHPDHDQLLDYFKACDEGELEEIFLVHGDPLQMEILARDVRLFSVHTPKPGYSFYL